MKGLYLFMKNFIKGIFFISLLLPILNGIISIYNYIIDYISAHIIYKTSEIQKKISSINTGAEEKMETNAIGFQMPLDDYCEDEEE